MDVVYLCCFAFLAGFVDSVVGGGGLIQLPAMLIFIPERLTATLAPIWGTNKFASICGTSMAVAQYSRRVKIQCRLLFPAAVAALIFSTLGARAVAKFPKEKLEPVILTMMVAVAAYTFSRKNFGHLHAPKLTPAQTKLFGILTGIVIGFYDGFFGPGTGSFLIFIFIGIFGFDFLNASAHAKVINLVTNLGPVVYFASTGNILYAYAIPMAVCNLLGSTAGSRLAVLKGNKFVRTFFLVVVSAMIVRYGWKVFTR